MSVLSAITPTSLDPKDRRMLLIALGLVVLLFTLLAVLSPAVDQNRNPVPNSYYPTQHGAKAAFTLLQQSGYTLERWEQPLADLAAKADASTVLILAQPFSYSEEARSAVQRILMRGGRVVATGYEGGLLLPRSSISTAKGVSFAACEAKPEGLTPLAAAGSIWIVPSVTWKEVSPETHVAYSCADLPVVVEYPVESGHAVWWAASTPLENGSIQRGANLELLLNSVGPAKGRHLYWDESLHNPPPSSWDYVRGPVWPLLAFGSLGLALLVILSFSRRSGPVRALPQAPRTTPIEFLDALGALYRSTGATTTALQIAWERFRTKAAHMTGLSGQSIAKLDAHEVGNALERRFGALGAAMQPDLTAAEEGCWNESLKPHKALVLVQALRKHEETLRTATSRAVIKEARSAPVTLQS